DKNKIENYVIIDTDKKLDYSICPECKAKPGDKIICKVGKDGMKIHGLGCKALKVLSYKKLLEAHWKGYDPEKYILKLTIDLIDKPGILLKLLSVFSDLNVNIGTINVDKSNNEGFTQVKVELQFFNPSKIDFVLKELKNKENYVRIIKKEIV
ncbi:MAG: ACT domain-containing protein, partial [Candidatus Absconditabacteria bacterium]